MLYILYAFNTPRSTLINNTYVNKYSCYLILKRVKNKVKSKHDVNNHDLLFYSFTSS